MFISTKCKNVLTRNVGTWSDDFLGQFSLSIPVKQITQNRMKTIKLQSYMFAVSNLKFPNSWRVKLFDIKNTEHFYLLRQKIIIMLNVP